MEEQFSTTRKGMHRNFTICLIVGLVVTMAIPISAAQSSVSQQRMATSALCPDQVLSSAYRSPPFGARGVLECVTRCLLSAGGCRSIVFDLHGSLCHLGRAPSRADCSNMEAGSGHLRFYQLPGDAEDLTTETSVTTGEPEKCLNGGHTSENGTCVCVNSHVGPLCERIVEDCEEALSSGFYTSSGLYRIHPARSPIPATMLCQFMTNVSGVARNVIFTRTHGNFSFNRTWQEFRQGFGDEDNFWLGLDTLHELTNSKTFELRFNIDNASTLVRSNFRSLVVGSRSSSYKFTVGANYRQSAEDCLTPLQGAKFSTYDSDRDGNASLNCAALYGGGWWYDGSSGYCSACNPLGPVLSGNGGKRLGMLGEMFWAGFKDVYPMPLVAYLRLPTPKIP